MAETHTCPNGHESSTGDWCDTCGAAIGGAAGTDASPPSPPSPATGAPATSGPVGNCPNCGTPRLAGEAFCEVCGLDYASGELPAAPEEPAPAGQAATGWTVTIEPDRDWFDHNEAESGRVVEYPAGAGRRTVELAGDVVHVGRRDDRDGWYPGIDLSAGHDDVAVSRRHADLRPHGSGWAIVDVGSTNGTVVNGEEIAPDRPAPLADGDVIHLGAFTRLTVHGPGEAGT